MAAEEKPSSLEENPRKPVRKASRPTKQRVRREVQSEADAGGKGPPDGANGVAAREDDPGAPDPAKGPPDHAVLLRAAAQSDVASDVDTLGFDPYVRAISDFLLSENTKPPLTLSIEGEWGCGKSTFMRLLGKKLSESAASSDAPLVFYFDAWRSDSQDAVWSAFAASFLRHVTKKRGLIRNAVSDLRLRKKRFNFVSAILALSWAVLLWLLWTGGLALIILAVFSNWTYPGAVVLRIGLGLVGVSPILVTIASAIRGMGQMVPSPWSATVDLLKYVDSPDYFSRRAVGEAFAEDLQRIIEVYVGRHRRIFVFVDDLDRADPSYAAVIMRGLNVLMSAGQSPFSADHDEQSQALQLVFILGLDRERVAAGIAAQMASILPFLGTQYRSGVSTEEVGIHYGREFLEKFIQIQFIVPRPSESNVSTYVKSFSEKPIEDAQPEISPPSPESERIFSADSSEIQSVVGLVAKALEYTPRRIKQFINVFRLQAYVARRTHQLDKLGLQQLGVALACLMTWPSLWSQLGRDGFFFSKIQRKDRAHDDSDTKEFQTIPQLESLLLEALNRGWTFDGRDFSVLLVTH